MELLTTCLYMALSWDTVELVVSRPVGPDHVMSDAFGGGFAINGTATVTFTFPPYLDP